MLVKKRRDIARLIGAALCAYLLVLQAVAGGIAMASHAAASADPFSTRCLNSDPAGDDGAASKDAVVSSCCTLGCAPAAALAPFEPVASVFRYDPRPTPRRSAGANVARPDAGLEHRTRRPRGPPALG